MSNFIILQKNIHFKILTLKPTIIDHQIKNAGCKSLRQPADYVLLKAYKLQYQPHLLNMK